VSWTHTAPAQEVHFGAGAVERTAEVLRRVGARDALLVTSPGAFASDAARRLERTLGHGLTSCFADVEAHAPAPVVQAAFLQARRDGVDSVVSLGGGSCADVAKAVCFFFEQEAGTPAMAVGDRPALPHVAVPTTLAGAALTTSFSMTEPATGQARGGAGPTLAPAGVLADPGVVAGTPPDVLVETGVTALAQAVEAALDSVSTPEARAVATAGARALHHWLPALAAEPADETALVAVLEGSLLAGRAVSADVTPSSLGLARLLGGRTGAPHRRLVAALLPPVAGRAVTGRPTDAADLARALEVTDVDAALEGLLADTGLATTLGECGVGTEDLEATTRLAQSDPAFRGMPEDDLRSLLDDAA